MASVTVEVPQAFRQINKVDDVPVRTSKVYLDGCMIMAGGFAAWKMFDGKKVEGSVAVCFGTFFMVLSILKGFFENKQMAEGFNVLNQNISTLDGNIEILKEDVRVLKEDVRVLKEDVKVLKKDLKDFKDEVRGEFKSIKGTLAIMMAKLGVDPVQINMLTGPAVLDANRQAAFEMQVGKVDSDPQAQVTDEEVVRDFVADVFDRVLGRDPGPRRAEAARQRESRTDANKESHPDDALAEIESREAYESGLRQRIGFTSV